MSIHFSTNTYPFIVGIFFILYSFFQAFRLLRLIVNGIKVNATIKDLIKVPRIHGYTVYFPILEYKTLTGESISRKSYIGKDNRHQQKIGDTIKIIYNPQKPEEYLLDKGIEKYMKAFGSFIVGTSFILAGIFKLF